MSTFLFTGFPGSLAREVVPRILGRARDTTAACVVRPPSAVRAARLVEEWELAERSLRGRIRLLEGDVTRPGLGLPEPESALRTVSMIFHLAGVAHPGTDREQAVRVNVGGTRHALEAANLCPTLERFHHLSTCFVSGRFAGLFGEEDLNRGQRFRNAWEESRFLAEAEVRRAAAGGLPTTIYRTGVLVGDAATGETAEYGGIYWLLRWILRQPRVAVVPVPPEPERVRLPLAPRDFVADALTHLSGLPQSRGRCYALADPDPPSLPELLAALGRAAGRRVRALSIPLRVARGLLERVPGAEWVAGAPAAAVGYLDHPGYYATTNARADLEASGIRPPPVQAYAAALVSFYREHRQVPWERAP